MTNTDIPLTGALEIALKNLYAACGDQRVQTVILENPARISFRKLLLLALTQLRFTLESKGIGALVGPSSRIVAERSLHVIREALASISESPIYETSLSARAGFGQLMDEVEGARIELKNSGDIQAVMEVIESVQRETGVMVAD